MAAFELHIMIRQLINNQGGQFLTEKRLMNILSDMGCFDDCRKSKLVLKTITENNYVNKILSYVNGNLTKDEAFDIILNDLSNIYHYPIRDISYSLQCILYGLNVIDVVETYADSKDFKWMLQLDKQKVTESNNTDEWNTEYVIVDVVPYNADVYIDGNIINHDEDSIVLELPCGNHHIKAKAPMCYDYESMFEVNENLTNQINVRLKPRYGSVLVMADAKDAIVYIDDIEIGTAPITLERIASGNHTLKITAPFHFEHKENFVVEDGEKVQRIIKLEPNYGEAELLSNDLNLNIFIDGVLKGKGKWYGKLSVGQHTIECRKESHYTKSINIQIKRDQKSTIVLPELDAFYGCLKINVKPVGSTILLDNKEIGKSPLKYKNALVGTHKLKVYNTLCNNILEKDIKIEEGVITTIEEVLGPQVFFQDYNRIAIGDYFYADGTYSHQLIETKKAIGVVFTLETSEEEKKQGWKHGQMIALENCVSGTNVAWERAIEHASNYRKQISSRYNSSWYLPTIQQWMKVMKNLANVEVSKTILYESQQKLKNLLRISEDSISNYWASKNENDRGKASILHIVPSKYHVEIINGGYGVGKVRAVAAF